MKKTEYFCDRCHKHVEGFSDLKTLDFNIKSGLSETSLPAIEDCCIECRNEIEEAIVKLILPLPKPEDES